MTLITQLEGEEDLGNKESGCLLPLGLVSSSPRHQTLRVRRLAGMGAVQKKEN